MMNWKNIRIPEEIEDLTSLQSQLKSNKSQIDKEFKDFYEKAQKIALEADKLLKRMFDSDPVQLETDIEEYVAYSYYIASLVADCQTFVNIYEVMHYIPKSKEISESDRTKFINIKILFQRNLLEKLTVIEESLGKKISAAQSILRYETTRFVKEK